MNFTSFEFVFFFAVILVLKRCMRSVSAEKWLLLVASICFYISSSFSCVFLILFTSISDYCIGRKLGQLHDIASRKWWLILGLGINLGLLGFFKYSNFVADNIYILLAFCGYDIHRVHFNINLPPGISFYTFASMSYVLDVYYERVTVCRSVRDYTLFLTFFPKLLSGPIVRAGELLPQLRERFSADAEDFEIGLTYVMIGAVKKLVIADQIAPHINLIFSAPTQFDGLSLLEGAIGYAIQIYCDFSGYSDMAIGFARMVGIGLPENFQMPYSSTNITEFWRRWHITLSRWFRDYVFLPLELATRGNPYPGARVSINILVMMLLVGLWHGPSWTFVVFGGIHGVALVIHKLWVVWKPTKALQGSPIYSGTSGVISHLLTLAVVVFAFIFFRANSFSSAINYLTRLVSWTHNGTRLTSPYILAATVAVLATHLIVGKDRNLALEFPKMAFIPRILGYAVLLLLLVVFGATDASPFIYFQF